jgi:hypothetical protein
MRPHPRCHIRERAAERAAELRGKITEKNKFIGCLGPRYCRITPYDTLLETA